MRIDEENYLRNVVWQGKTVRFNGDEECFLRSLGPHDPPNSSKPDMMNKMGSSSSSGELKIIIRSSSYWGFGLFAKCFYNEISLLDLCL